MKLPLSVCVSFLGPSHTKRPSVGFRAARQRRYKILLLRPVRGVCAARQLVLISDAWRQKHVSGGIEPALFLAHYAWYDQSEQEQRESLRPHVETSNLADLKKDVNLKLIQLQTVLLL